MEIDGKVVCIDGYSRLVAAIKGFRYVYGFFEDDIGSLDFYRTCLKWCKDENILTISDLANRIVAPAKHQELWIDRCQEYLRR